MRLIPIILILICLFLIIRLFFVKPKTANSKKTANSDTPAKALMVPCSLCQLHLPEQEALKKGSELFCCTAHLEQWEKQQRGH